MVQKDLEGREVISGECTSSRREGAGLDTGGLVGGRGRRALRMTTVKCYPANDGSH